MPRRDRGGATLRATSRGRGARARSAAMMALLTLASCKVGPEYEKHSIALPPHFTDDVKKGTDAAAAKLRDWWTNFNDPVLTRLIGQAIAGNLDLQMMRQRLIEARSERIIAGSLLYPQVESAASASLNYSSETVTWPPGRGAYRVYTAGFDATWELDVFGGIRRGEEAAGDEVDAVIEQRRGALISVISELAGDYAALRATQMRIEIAEHNLTTARRLTALTTTEYEHGLTTSLAVAQAEAQTSTVEAALPDLHAQVAQLTHVIAILLGRFPGELEAELSQPAPIIPVPPALPATVPSEVVANRPDVRQSERMLAAATARVGVAVSQMYPHFKIPLILKPDTSYMAEFFQAQSLLWSAGLSISENIYTGGRLTAQVKEARAEAERQKISYRQTVLQAFREVEDSLVKYASESQRVEFFKEAALHDHEALDRAQRLYEAGLTDFLNLLTAERGVYAAEDAVAVAELERLRSLISLYKALGGGWQSVSFEDEQEAH